MIRLVYKYAGPSVEPTTTATLDYDARQKSRQRLALDNGDSAGMVLARGSTLSDGDILTDAEQSLFVRVVAAAEPLSYIQCVDRLLLNRICYHLGNRHVPLQVHADAVAYRHDHVLDDMVAGLGVTPQVCRAAFHPEPGAYDHHGHGHGHGHGHEHEHEHEHEHHVGVADEDLSRLHG